MTATIRTLIAGNWKMNGFADSLVEASAVSSALSRDPPRCRVALCPPSTLLSRMSGELRGGPVELGAQDCHAAPSGAFTGDISAEMLRDAGAHLIILGHSERRAGHGERDEDVRNKALAALRAGLEPIVCAGETLEQREAGSAIEVVCSQLAGSIPKDLDGRRFAVAYEPVWAIGTGRTPTLAEIEEIHVSIRALLNDRFPLSAPPILYGGSVSATNAVAILAVPEVGGALVGGASLKASAFLPVVRAA